MDAPRFVQLSIFFLISTIVTLGTAALAAELPVPKSPVPSACPTPRPFSSEVLRAQLSADPKIYKHARVLVGVDVLGRLVAAIDSDRDGRVNEYLMFVDESRFEGPWSTVLDRATVFTSQGAARIEAEDFAFGAGVVMKGGAQPALTRKPDAFARSLIRSSGAALLRVSNGVSEGVPLTNLDVSNIYSWPDAFQQQEDVPEPQTDWCSDCANPPPQCDSGGCGSNGCMIASTAVPPLPGCSVMCREGQYACCNNRFMAAPICTCRKCGN